ncbi:hypothetical protein CcaverHIS002_0113350 [Cutaneotrichosporon cavernicola]|uniref:Uncharacterized protein n=1 Tax=Cutaneotrichosporon cavernicola TaxID=279322 RepID=A0AA48I2X7_9TREE|nr:uncharacterized protein CcaverHIS019_0113220 [Cutaneotrichosporon cavernicola]BEI80806.1 hypothetical protein CcaverHIS002_0113350 [Cutaneotrichosporon cavernicola]BEI88604.1 hypothetical protein CcaverHIS019_0113220 [Cutaneotrichosporon cavernicola]BEI96377.1 hypothetical protein CcaverHIS631_0113260 [Cutaneotrichosporon cavernicola]BEJ04149.1 hypothetical protein CcaverHIS641_0113240 [Cutaneotrichosporon cavernicola]
MLDASFFPHIVDLIFKFAPHASLLRLRTVSNDFRSTADQWLVAGRLIVTPSTRTNGKISCCLTNSLVNNGGGSDPSQLGNWQRPQRRLQYVEDFADDLHFRLVVSSQRGRVPAFAALDLDDKTLCYPDTNDLRHTRILDFVGIGMLLSPRYGEIPQFPPFPVDLPMPTSLHRPHITVRHLHRLQEDNRGDLDLIHSLRPSKHSANAQETLVVFSTLPELWRPTNDLPASLRPSAVPTKPSPIRRIIINIVLHPQDQLHSQNLHRFPPLYASEITFVFHRAAYPITYNSDHDHDCDYDIFTDSDTTDDPYPFYDVEDNYPYSIADTLGLVLEIIGGALGAGSAITLVGLEVFTEPWPKEPNNNRDENDPIWRILLWGHLNCVWMLEEGSTFSPNEGDDHDDDDDDDDDDYQHPTVIIPTPDDQGNVTVKLIRTNTDVTIKFMTLADFRAELGPERAGIETTERGWLV